MVGKKSKVTPVRGHTRKYKRPVTEYKNKAGVTFKAGDRVGLTSKAFNTYQKSDDPTFAGQAVRTARISTLLPDVKGLVQLATRLGGYWTWDVNDLEKR